MAIYARYPEPAYADATGDQLRKGMYTSYLLGRQYLINCIDISAALKTFYVKLVPSAVGGADVTVCRFIHLFLFRSS